MWSKENQENAMKFCNAIRLMATKPDNINNLESYLTCHFDEWLEKYGNDPENLASELELFAGFIF